eukprot:COSAG01_NODE_52242_length_348_cov_0.622490_1_plen_28_part_01
MEFEASAQGKRRTTVRAMGTRHLVRLSG